MRTKQLRGEIDKNAAAVKLRVFCFLQYEDDGGEVGQKKFMFARQHEMNNSTEHTSRKSRKRDLY